MSVDSNSKKQQAAETALRHVRANTVIGVGTGSTVNHFIDALARGTVRVSGAVSSTSRVRPYGPTTGWWPTPASSPLPACSDPSRAG